RVLHRYLTVCSLASSPCSYVQRTDRPISPRHHSPPRCRPVTTPGAYLCHPPTPEKTTPAFRSNVYGTHVLPATFRVAVFATVKLWQRINGDIYIYCCLFSREHRKQSLLQVGYWNSMWNINSFACKNFSDAF
uniref:Uncharacterized protein n=1 Tax=Aegilops tauschii subsp. strangulata TaxID=200361 RepID=A0A452YYS4_AEGTS